MGYVFCGLIVFSLFFRLYIGRRIDVRLGFNMVVVGKSKTTIMSFKPESLSIDYVELPDDLKIDLSVGGPDFGIKELREVEVVGDVTLESFRRGLSLDLGIVLTVIIRHEGENDLISVRESLMDFGKTKTNLNFLDRLEIVRLLDVVLARGLNLSQSFPSRLTDRIIELDGKSYLKVNDSIYAWTRNYFMSEAVLSETAEIMVVNESGIEGTGRKVSKQVETVGMRVVEVRASDVVLDKKCVVNGDKMKHPMTMKYLEKYLECEVGADGLEVRETDMIILIGKRF